MPANPRSLYEERMHINEQRPLALKSTLDRYFPAVYVWSGSIAAEEQLTDIEKQGIENEVTAAAGKNIRAEDLLKQISNGKLEKENVSVRIICETECVTPDGRKLLVIPVKIENTGKGVLKSQQPYPVHLSYHIRRENGEIAVYDGIRSVLSTAIRPGMSGEVWLEVSTQELAKGDYWIEPDLVQEGWMWFREVCQIHTRIKLVV